MVALFDGLALEREDNPGVAHKDISLGFRRLRTTKVYDTFWCFAGERHEISDLIPAAQFRQVAISEVRRRSSLIVCSRMRSRR
jgi:hypothetical protein